MNRLSVLLSATALVLLVAMGCAGSGNPVTGGSEPGNLQSAKTDHNSVSQPNLWGYWDVEIDTQAKTVSATTNRQAMFTANVTGFLNSSPAAMSFKINNIVVGTDYTDVDINVGLTHPFPGMPQYNGYDVRGVFMGNGSATLAYNNKLAYSMPGTDQFMFPNPTGGNGGPDGYTRWYNLTEFATGGAPMFQYIKGKMATNGFDGTATLNPYKYFADGLGVDDNLWDWLAANPDSHGVFSSGTKNTRNYYLRFPNTTHVVYGYAVIANWQGTTSGDHPSNANEAVGCKIANNSSLFFVDPSNKGGNLTLDVSVYDWHSQLSAGVMEDYKIFVESPVLASPHAFTLSEMTPTGGGQNYSTYTIDLAGDPTSSGTPTNNWIIVEYPGKDYTNPFGVTNLAGTDPLAAFFRFDVTVSPSATSQDPICDLKLITTMPTEGWDGGVPVEFDASGSTDPQGLSLTYSWDFDGDGTFDGPADMFRGTPDKPLHGYTANYNGKAYVKVSNGQGGESICDVDVQVTAHPSKNLPLDGTLKAVDLALDHTNGDLIVMLSDGVPGLGNPADQVWRYPRSTWYTTGSKMFDLYWGSPDGTSMDMSPDQVTVLSANHIAGVYNTQIWGADNQMIYALQQGGPNTPNIDMYAICGGTHKDDVGNILAWPDNNATFAVRYPKDNYFYGAYWYYYWPTIYTGIDQIYWDYIVAVESNAAGDCIWYLEDAPEYYVSRWKLYDTFSGYGDQKYDNAYFGTGSQTDSDDGWWQSKDITRDNLDRYFVLDQLSTGEPRIKMWTVDGDTTTSKGGFGDSTSINSAPLRLEGSDWSGDIVALHGPTAPSKVSVFVPWEMPE